MESTGSLTVVRYIILGLEVAPSTGQNHIQGYAELAKASTLSSLKKLLTPWFPGSHLEACAGSSKQNIAYCKKDGKFFEFGTPCEQGKRTDLESVFNTLSSGGTLRDVAEQDFGTFLRYQRGLVTFRSMILSTANYERPEVFVRWGLPGTGKTRFVFDNHCHDQIWTWPGGPWFDGYDGHEVALFDDFDGSCGINFRTLLRILDRYRIDVPVKGAHVPWRPKTIFITSNRPPVEWYPYSLADYPALERRFTLITEVVN